MGIPDARFRGPEPRPPSGGPTLPLACVVLLGLAMSYPSAQAQTLTVLYSFTGSGGASPYAGLVGDSAGNLYGTAYGGGSAACALGCGTVFKLNANRREKTLYRFTGKSDGASPLAALIRDADGNLYGTTRYGGNFVCGGGCGTVFKVDTTGKETVLYSFTGAPDGSVPQASLIRDSSGTFYGTTINGGDVTCSNPAGCGTVFKLDASGNETVLYSFTGKGDGRSPSAGLVRDAAGNLFGTTTGGGASGFGTVFKLDATGNETVLHSFAGGSDGAGPSAGLIPGGPDLYGTTVGGGRRASEPCSSWIRAATRL